MPIQKWTSNGFALNEKGLIRHFKATTSDLKAKVEELQVKEEKTLQRLKMAYYKNQEENQSRSRGIKWDDPNGNIP